MPDGRIELAYRDERQIKIPVPASRDETRALATFLGQAESDGYIVKHASDIQGGSQRDPYVVGLSITVERDTAE